MNLPIFGANPPVLADWTKVSPPSVQTLGELVQWSAQTYGDMMLSEFDGKAISHNELDRQSRQLAGVLMAHGIGRTSRVGVLMPNGPEFLVNWFALVRIGAVAVPISTLSSPIELRGIAARAGLCLMIATGSYLGHDFAARIDTAFEFTNRDGCWASAHAPHLKSVWFTDIDPPAGWARRLDAARMASVPVSDVETAESQVTAADEATIIFTSGSTALPKGVIHSQGNLVRAGRRWAAVMPYSRDERLFYCAPFFWVGGMVVGFLTMMNSGTFMIGLSSHNATDILDCVSDRQCHYLKCSAAAARSLSVEPRLHDRDYSHLKAGSLQAILAPELRTRNQVYFGNSLGMSETAGPHTVPLRDIVDGFTGSMGPATPGMEHRIVDPETRAVLPDGQRDELQVRGDTLMLGYVGRERHECFDPDGWFNTGDECEWRDGHLILHGRLDDMIKTSGANVAPAEVEAALTSLPGVEQACVTGLPDAERGAIVVAMIIPQPGATLNEAELTAGLRQQLSAFKVPRRYAFVSEIPQTATGKFAKNKVRDLMLGNAI